MGYGMTFRGELTFASPEAVTEAFGALTDRGDDCLVRPQDCRRDGVRLVIDVSIHAPASCWFVTLGALRELSVAAATGGVEATYEGDDVERVSFVAGEGERRPAVPKAPPVVARVEPGLRAWRRVRLPAGVTIAAALHALEQAFLDRKCLVARPGPNGACWVHSVRHDPYPDLTFDPVSDREIVASRWWPTGAKSASLARTLTAALKRLAAEWDEL